MVVRLLHGNGPFRRSPLCIYIGLMAARRKGCPAQLPPIRVARIAHRTRGGGGGGGGRAGGGGGARGSGGPPPPPPRPHAATAASALANASPMPSPARLGITPAWSPSRNRPGDVTRARQP